ncbi:hypothetical protein PsYK624_042040 [Phanerochaete sordida]|uniref:Uncharacterized protein n=1 Tax=Phanerochaete sordida TaxID=48140 RepID=A0A9P3LA86_9APHY|nr:hypothetical protein PsYK624_042040 [Phanerochaete sordida]
MFARKRKCFCYLKHLCLHSFPQLYDQPRFGKVLAALFTRATELETLSLLSCEILEVGQQVGDAFAQMKSLRVLRILDFSDHTRALLARMRTPLVCVDFNLSRLDLDQEDPVPILAPFRDTLRHVKVNWVDFTSAETQFPHVTTLEAELCHPGGLGEIAQCFPGLQNFRMHTAREDGWDDDEAEEIRAHNLQSQAVHTWPSLNSLSGSAVTLYVLGVRCHVAHIDVSCGILVEPVDGERLAVVLADARPTRLSVHIRAWEFDATSLAQYLLPAKDSLVTLTLRIDFRGEQYEDPSPQIHAMLATLSLLSLRTIDLWVNWERPMRIYKMRFSPDDQTESSEDEEPGQSIADLDLAAIALQAACSIATLQFAIVDGRYPLRTKFFKISRNVDGPQDTPTVVELEDGNADREALCKEQYTRRAADCHSSCSMYP